MLYTASMLKDLFDLFFVFFKIGAVTFGGGYAMLPVLERELAVKRNWTTSEDLLDYYAISQVTPGVIAVNVSTFVGYKRRRVAGGIFATLGLVTPSIIIITIIAIFISNFESIEWVARALRGINVSVAALLTASVVNFARKTLKKWWSYIFYAAAFCCVYFLKVPSVAVILASAAGGMIIGWASGALKKVDAVGANVSSGTEGVCGAADVSGGSEVSCGAVDESSDSDGASGAGETSSGGEK